MILYELFRWGDPEQLGSGAVHDIVWLIRLPRVVLAVLVGMGLSVVGAVMQAIVKNPLADPYVLGISSGASLGATLTLLLGAGLFGAAGVGLGAFIGALAGRIFRNRHCRHRGAHHFGKADFGRRCTELALLCFFEPDRVRRG